MTDVSKRSPWDSQTQDLSSTIPIVDYIPQPTVKWYLSQRRKRMIPHVITHHTIPIFTRTYYFTNLWLIYLFCVFRHVFHLQVVMKYILRISFLCKLRQVCRSKPVNFFEIGYCQAVSMLCKLQWNLRFLLKHRPLF